VVEEEEEEDEEEEEEEKERRREERRGEEMLHEYIAGEEKKEVGQAVRGLGLSQRGLAIFDTGWLPRGHAGGSYCTVRAVNHEQRIDSDHAEV
jgi:hypothetical protein